MLRNNFYRPCDVIEIADELTNSNASNDEHDDEDRDVTGDQFH